MRYFKRINMFSVVCFGFLIGTELCYAAPSAADAKMENKDNVAPIKFPNDTTHYKIIVADVKTAKALSHLNDSSTEVQDMLATNKESEVKESKPQIITKDGKSKDKTTPINKPISGNSTAIVVTTMAPLTAKPNDKTAEEDPNIQTEDVQPDTEETQSNEHEEQFHKRVDPPHAELKAEQSQKAENPSHGFNGGYTAAIFAGVFAVVAVVGYAGLIIWRQVLEKKYGTRERLVTEDSYYTINDMRHFEL